MNAAHSSARLVGWSQWVDATLSSNPTALKNNGYIHSAWLDQPEHYPAWVLTKCSQTDRFSRGSIGGP